jgi:lipooligosaccharide transport system permease protein
MPQSARSQPSLAVFEHMMYGYRRVWRGTVFSSFVLPVLFLLGMGLTVGRYVDARSHVLGVPYLDYIAPGVLAATALQVAVGESTWPVLASFVGTRTYHAMRATPIGPADIVIGHLGYVLLRVLLSACGFLAVMAVFGAVHSPWGLAALPAALLVGLATAAPVLAYSATITNDGLFAVLFRVAVVPMTLFAGVFFPVGSLPLLPRALAYASPLWHGVELCRAATLGVGQPVALAGHVAYLVLWGSIGYLLARARFTRRLTD